MSWNFSPAVGPDGGVDAEGLRLLSAQAEAARAAVEREMDRTEGDVGARVDLGAAYVDLRVARDALSGAAAQIDRYMGRRA